MGRLTNKRAFITGAGRGIGAELARVFAAEGAELGLADIDGSLLDRLELSADDFVVDVSNRAELASAIDRFAAGGLDILINNAVIFAYAPLVEFDVGMTDRMIDIGVKGTFWGMMAATPHLVRRGGGTIINMSSVAVSYAIRGGAVYSSIKGAIDALTRQQAVELGPHGIRVNALAPGPVRTPATNSRTSEERWEERRRAAPLQRLPSATDVANAAVFLASDEAVSTTGIRLRIDGGLAVGGAR